MGNVLIYILPLLSKIRIMDRFPPGSKSIQKPDGFSKKGNACKMGSVLIYILPLLSKIRIMEIVSQPGYNCIQKRGGFSKKRNVCKILWRMPCYTSSRCFQKADASKMFPHLDPNPSRNQTGFRKK